MGLYDTFVDGENEDQIKAFRQEMRRYDPGDLVPCEEFEYPDDFTIATPCFEDPVCNADAATIMTRAIRNDSVPSCLFIIIEKRRFKKMTRDPKEIVKPLFDKWGELL